MKDRSVLRADVPGLAPARLDDGECVAELGYTRKGKISVWRSAQPRGRIGLRRKPVEIAPSTINRLSLTSTLRRVRMKAEGM